MNKNAENRLAEEAKLVARFRNQRDDQAFRKLFQNYRDRIWHTIFAKGIPAKEAETVLQEVATSIFRFLINETPDNLAAVVYRLTEWKVADYYRKNQHHRRNESLDSLKKEGREPVATDPVSPRDLDGFRQQLRLCRLSKEQQEAVLLHYVVGYTIPEIATITDSPIETVRSRLRFARRKLTKYLKRGKQK